jgi:hypothetical protein
MLPRAALLQLPVPDTRVEAARSNVPLAAGYLAAWASDAGGPPVSLAPRMLQDHGGDAAILAWLEAERPSVVGFTAFLWNIDRTLWLARALKSRTPGTLVVLGGPEIAPGHPLLEPGAAPEVDSFAVGEGEEAWADLLRALARGARPPRVIRSRPPLDASRLPNPYLAGALPIARGDSVFLETVRGCTRHCDYCYYAKASSGLRSLPREHLAPVFALARERGAADIYVMDPCFNASADFRDKLREIAAANTSRIPLHTELELEAVTSEAADLLALAGFVSVEAGLQSTNRAALRAVHRGWRKAEFLRGAERLRERGIAVRTGIILGLPRDTMEGFLRTIELVKENGLADGAEIYPLAVLPGTALRSRAAELGLESMSLPPYWVLSNTAMREPDFIEAIELAEAALEIDFFQPVLPSFGDPAPGFLGFRDLREPGSASRFLVELLARPERLASRLTLLLRGPLPLEPDALEAMGRRLAASGPHTLTTIVVDCDSPPPYAPWDRVARSFFVPSHYFDRIHYYKRDRQERFSVRLVHLTGSEGAAERSYTDPEASPFDLLLRFAPALLREGSVLDRLPPLLVPAALGPAARSALAERYRGAEGLIVREG